MNLILLDYNYINYNTIALVWSLNFIQQKAAGLDQKIIYSQCIPPPVIGCNFNIEQHFRVKLQRPNVIDYSSRSEEDIDPPLDVRWGWGESPGPPGSVSVYINP